MLTPPLSLAHMYSTHYSHESRNSLSLVIVSYPCCCFYMPLLLLVLLVVQTLVNHNMSLQQQSMLLLLVKLLCKC